MRRISMATRDELVAAVSERYRRASWADQPLRLAQRQAEHGLERQSGQDRQGRIPALAAAGRAWLGLPGHDRIVRKPDRSAVVWDQRILRAALRRTSSGLAFSLSHLLARGIVTGRPRPDFGAWGGLLRPSRA